MYYSWNLVKRFINVEDDIENIANNLTMKSCEIEEIEKREIPNDVIIWKCTKVEKHPNADSLFVCQINCGEKWKYQICTWWENVKKDKYVPVAIPWSYLPIIDLKIEWRQMRWLDSNGMICSKSELWINEDQDKHWIWILDEDVDELKDEDIGKPLGDKLKRLNNCILNVDNKTITNRPDLTWHFGLAVELNGIYWTKDKIGLNRLQTYINDFANTNVFDTLGNANKLDRNIINETSEKDLNTYILLWLKNIEIKKSSFFTRMINLDLWITPRNNWVDFSNIFMNISGNPIHFFDEAKVNGDVIVRYARKWEEFIDLFDQKHILEKTDIVIADMDKILALAWVIWWKDSWIDENTKNILIEIANFDATKVRKTWTRLGIRTDAEMRFEKNISPIYSLYVFMIFLDELKYFKKDLGNYNISWLDYYYDNSLMYNQKYINIDNTKLQKFIFGKEIEWLNNKIDEILDDLWFTKKQDNKRLVPIWRWPKDINIVEDIYEEFIRIYGYENIESQKMNWKVEIVNYTKDVELTRNLEKIIKCDLWFDQVETYPWIENKLLESFGIERDQLFSLKNPLASENKYIKDSLSYNLIKVIEKNSKFFDYIKIFEIGKIWNFIDNKKIENKNISMTIYQKESKNWETDGFLYLKWCIDIILDKLWIKWKLEYKLSETKNYHPKKQAYIVFNWKNIWKIWQLHPIHFETFKFGEKVQIVNMEISFEILLDFVEQQSKWIKISKYETLQDQIIYRDLNFVIPLDTSFNLISNSVKKIKEIESIEVFDIYSGENIEQWKKSISIKIKIKWDGNIKTEDINKIMDKAISSVEENWWELRK